MSKDTTLNNTIVTENIDILNLNKKKERNGWGLITVHPNSLVHQRTTLQAFKSGLLNSNRQYLEATHAPCSCVCKMSYLGYFERCE